MNQPVKYKPVDIIRWIDFTTESHNKTHTKESPFPKTIKQALQKMVNLSKTTTAQVARNAIEQLEYRLYHDSLEMHSQTGFRSILYSQVTHIEILKREAFRIRTEKETVRIKPYAWMIVANLKIPLGWRREDMEVPYHLLLEEIAARTKAPIVYP
jgi:hypothetical protein